MKRDELGAFLRSHRDALSPTEVGLAEGHRRRTPGLRREEVAVLAGMSTDYYSRLEQGRGPQPSVQMLDAIARALRLLTEEREYLHRVAGHNPPPRVGVSGDYVAPALQRVLDRLSDTPAMILTQIGEVLVQNLPARALLGDRTGYVGKDRSDIYRWFTYPEVERAYYPPEDHLRQSRAHVAALRAAMGAGGVGISAERIVESLRRTSREFALLWEKHEVATRFTDRKTIIHPEIGAICLDCQALFTQDQSQALMVLTARPNSKDFRKLELVTATAPESSG